MNPCPSTPCFVVISPVRNEAVYLDQTIACVVAQTCRPAQYILVDDGSTDSTLAIIKAWAAKHPWIIPVHKPGISPGKTGPAVEKTRDRGMRAREAKEIIAFYFGLDYLEEASWAFLVKLDGDLSFAPDYFERCFNEFDRDPLLGVGGGQICHLNAGVSIVEHNPNFHVRGATKIYRRLCWEAIGGVSHGAAWDTLDEVKANMLGWKSRSFHGIQVIHHRYTGAANGQWQNAVKKGEWNYISGYHPLFMTSKFVRNLLKPPYLKGAVGLMYGFLVAAWRGVARINDPQLIRYLQDQQLRRLCFRKTIWR